jgi:hypothetical protein
MRRRPLFRRHPDPGPSAGARHVQPIALRQTWAGSAARWAIRQGLVSLGLHTGGFAAFVIAAFLVFVPLGFVVLGAALITLETLTRQDAP